MADARLRLVDSDRITNPETILSTGLNSLANGSAALSAAFHNDQGDRWVDLELNLGTFGSAPTEDGPVDIYLVQSVDATNYETEVSEGRPRDGYVGSFRLNNVTTAQRLILRRIPAPVGDSGENLDHKWYLINNCGQAFNASGNTLKARYYTEIADEA